MLYFLSNLANYKNDFPFLGPFRIFSSHLTLMGIGVVLAAIFTWIFIPKLKHLLPTDRGKDFACEGAKSKGKPQAAGVIFISIFVFICVLVLPPNDPHFRALQAAICIFFTMLTGFFDDISKKPWGQLLKGLCDLLIAIITAVVVCQLDSVQIWLPFTKHFYSCPPWLFILISVPILWIMINSTNCTDGVDALAGTLSIFPIIFLAIILYVFLGHSEISNYLLLPHYAYGAHWAILLMVLAGTISGYLWYNAEPSEVLMGDAGSRAIGLSLGIGVIASGNFFLMFVVAPIILINGGAGLVKIIMIRLLRKLGISTEKKENSSIIVKLIHRYRFPLHDYCRKEKKWSNAKVLMRFTILQIWLLIILFALIIKIR